MIRIRIEIYGLDEARKERRVTMSSLAELAD
jgi:hypothetical protein